MPTWDVIDLRVRSQLAERIPPSLVTFFNNHPEPCGVKDRCSRFLYANIAYKAMLGLPGTFSIAGLSDSDFPSVTVLSFDIEQHVVEQEQRQISSLAICSFVKNKGMRAYFFDKMPFYDEKGQIAGTFFQVKEAKYLPIDFYSKRGVF